MAGALEQLSDLATLIFCGETIKTAVTKTKVKKDAKDPGFANLLIMLIRLFINLLLLKLFN